MAVLTNRLAPTGAAVYVSLDSALGTAGLISEVITCESEQMRVLSGSGTTGLTVERGVGGTTIAEHAIGTTVTLTSSLNASISELNAVADASAFRATATATADGTGTGTLTCSGVINYVSVTASNSAHIVVLPAPVVGTIIILDVGANGFKLASSTPASIAINGGTGASAASTIAANSTCVMVCVSATAWKGFFLDADSDVAKVAAAA